MVNTNPYLQMANCYMVTRLTDDGLNTRNRLFLQAVLTKKSKFMYSEIIFTTGVLFSLFILAFVTLNESWQQDQVN
jgi:hypothetical protein